MGRGAVIWKSDFFCWNKVGNDVCFWEEILFSFMGRHCSAGSILKSLQQQSSFSEETKQHLSPVSSITVEEKKGKKDKKITK